MYGVRRGSYQISGSPNKKGVRSEKVGATEASDCCATCVGRRCNAWYYGRSNASNALYANESHTSAPRLTLSPLWRADGTLKVCHLNYAASSPGNCDEFLEGESSQALVAQKGPDVMSAHPLVKEVMVCTSVE